MIINGLQKLTLLDFPGHTACTVFLAGCDFSCPFCHNSDLIPGDADVFCTEEEFFAFLKDRKGRLDGVAVTGGEPTLRKELPEFCRMIKDLGYGVKLDTNGNHPQVLKKLIDEKLVDYVAMDIKNSPEKYAVTAGLEHFDTGKISESLSILKTSGIDYELRTTVVDQLHDAGSFKEIGPWIAGAPRYFLQAFADRDSVRFAGLSAPSKERMEEYAELVRPYVGSVSLRGI